MEWNYYAWNEDSWDYYRVDCEFSLKSVDRVKNLLAGLELSSKNHLKSCQASKLSWRRMEYFNATLLIFSRYNTMLTFFTFKRMNLLVFIFLIASFTSFHLIYSSIYTSSCTMIIYIYMNNKDAPLSTYGIFNMSIVDVVTYVIFSI